MYLLLNNYGVGGGGTDCIIKRPFNSLSLPNSLNCFVLTETMCASVYSYVNLCTDFTFNITYVQTDHSFANKQFRRCLQKYCCDFIQRVHSRTSTLTTYLYLFLPLHREPKPTITKHFLNDDLHRKCIFFPAHRGQIVNKKGQNVLFNWCKSKYNSTKRRLINFISAQFWSMCQQTVKEINNRLCPNRTPTQEGIV